MNLKEFLNEIELQVIKKSLDIPTNLVPTIKKIVVTKEMWDLLGKDRMFQICIKHKPIYRYLEIRITKREWETKWFKIIPQPNMGGIPLELGETMDVIMEGQSPVKRKFKKTIHSETYIT